MKWRLSMQACSKVSGLFLFSSGGETAAETGLWAALGGETKGTHSAYTHEHLPQGKYAQLGPTGTQNAHH